MENAGYTTLTRQAGLLKEMQATANNIANLSTTGFRKEGVIFSEFVKDLGRGNESISMADGNVRQTTLVNGSLTQTNGSFDLAIEGSGFFLVATPEGDQLTRAGNFSTSATGELVTPDGFQVLDNGGAPVFIPPDAKNVTIASDGTVSDRGLPLAQLGLWAPIDNLDLERRDGVRFAAPNGVEPIAEGGVILQGYLESSNVNSVAEITRMIEVQRAYELGQSFMDKEDERIRSVLRTVGS
jgi:flagellar basal-body rod protein FlgF